MTKASTDAERLSHRLDPETYELSESYFAMPRIYVDCYYPPGTLTHTETRRMMHLHYSRNKEYGTTKAGRKDFMNLFGNIGPADFARIENSLIARGFISVDTATKTTTWYKILAPPVYDIVNDRLVSLYPGRVLNSSMMNNFIKIPSVIVKNGIFSKRCNNALSFNETMLLLKLYRHNELSAFGGVDCNLFSIQEERTFINKSMFMDINLSKHEFDRALEGLLKRELVSYVDIDVDRYFLDKSIALLCFASDAALNLGSAESKKITVLRPYYQPPLSNIGGKSKRK